MGYSSGLKNKLNAKAESNNNICLSRGTMPFSAAFFHMSWWVDFQHPLYQKWTHMYVRTDKHTNLLSDTHFDNVHVWNDKKDGERERLNINEECMAVCVCA